MHAAWMHARSSAAAASLGSGLLMAAAGYTALGILGAGAVVIPVVVLRRHRRAEREAEHRHVDPAEAALEGPGGTSAT